MSARRASGALLGLAIVLLNLLAPLGMSPVRLDTRFASVDPALAEAAKAFGQRIVICTPSGMITIGPDGKPSGAPAGDGHSGLCAFCLPLLGGMCAPAGGAAEIPAPTSAGLLDARPHIVNWELAPVRTWTARPRAPPLT